jgi:alanyl-tRNA synthetase
MDQEKGIFKTLVQTLPKTEFLGYELTEADSALLAIIKDSTVVNTAREGDEVELVFNRTPCYGESGGQIGDTAVAVLGDTRVEIQDTKIHQGVFTHKSLVTSGLIHTSKTFHIVIDKERRDAIRRNHTATHLLHAALKQVLGDHVKQAGSLVAPDRLRFDFTHFTSMKAEEIQEVEQLVNQKIIENLPVQVQPMTLDEAILSGAVALFGEKYGNTVRVVRTGDFSAELCGGTHCHATGDIGPFKIVSESSVAAGIRRIEAITGYAARDYYVQIDQTLARIAELLKGDRNSVEERVQGLVKSSKILQKEIDRLKASSAACDIEALPSEAIEVKGIKVLTKRMDRLDMKTLRETADKIKNLVQSGVVVLASVIEDKVFYVAIVTKELTNKIKAGDILNIITHGKGGGRPDMAQGGTSDIDGVDKALASVKAIVEEKSGS